MQHTTDNLLYVGIQKHAQLTIYSMLVYKTPNILYVGI